MNFISILLFVLAALYMVFTYIVTGFRTHSTDSEEFIFRWTDLIFPASLVLLGFILRNNTSKNL